MKILLIVLFLSFVFASIPINATNTIQNELDEMSSLYRKKVQNVQERIEKQEAKLTKIKKQIKKVLEALDISEAKRKSNEKTFSQLVFRKNKSGNNKETLKYLNIRLKQTRKTIALSKLQEKKLKIKERLLKLKKRNTIEYIDYLQKRITAVSKKYSTLVDNLNTKKNNYITLWDKYQKQINEQKEMNDTINQLTQNIQKNTNSKEVNEQVKLIQEVKNAYKQSENKKLFLIEKLHDFIPIENKEIETTRNTIHSLLKKYKSKLLKKQNEFKKEKKVLKQLKTELKNEKKETVIDEERINDLVKEIDKRQRRVLKIHKKIMDIKKIISEKQTELKDKMITFQKENEIKFNEQLRKRIVFSQEKCQSIAREIRSLRSSIKKTIDDIQKETLNKTISLKLIEYHECTDEVIKFEKRLDRFIRQKQNRIRSEKENLFREKSYLRRKLIELEGLAEKRKISGRGVVSKQEKKYIIKAYAQIHSKIDVVKRELDSVIFEIRQLQQEQVNKISSIVNDITQKEQKMDFENKQMRKKILDFGEMIKEKTIELKTLQKNAKKVATKLKLKKEQIEQAEKERQSKLIAVDKEIKNVELQLNSFTKVESQLDKLKYQSLEARLNTLRNEKKGLLDAAPKK
ncbi:cytoskeletal protein Sojo, putative [Entamoeba dispar SAW760]|uniref:Cytoskeletal protein Sojo, putative n=1 Tax=Entamoeba dispar (strain ATCC PRA-260 / SAW760) TaxID=370354 RepID=B0E991_ENTDS|nr:cytoskeletal protein Sojo, putative [Entamoeba dispar SAW760]EDR28920.1 cytoskeletal protein Sojo, putative [Entamoeba dispar SAW760]|eukprot:EDR28920.1 cytoskeletal protein Sojo, putative [Entamoeba dispar SAW760]